MTLAVLHRSWRRESLQRIATTYATGSCQKPKSRSTLMSILLEGTISDRPNSFSFSLQGKKKSWASHGLLEKVEEISISLRLLTGSHVYAIEYRIAATTSWAALNASCRWFMSFMSPRPSGAESYSGEMWQRHSVQVHRVY